MIMQKAAGLIYLRELEEKPQKWLNVVLQKSCNKQSNNNKVLKIWKEY